MQVRTLLSLALVVGLVGPADAIVSSARTSHAASTAAPAEIVWGRLRLALPAGWTIEARDDGPIGHSRDGNEDVRITLFGAPLALRNATPAAHLKRYIDNLSRPDPEWPGIKDVVPYTPFAMPGGEPATMRIEDLGDDDFVVEFAVALPGELYAINFYRTGNPKDAAVAYTELVRHARFVPEGDRAYE